MNTNPNWDLDTIFPGGSQSTELAAFLEQLEQDFTQVESNELPGPLDEPGQSTWIETIQTCYDLTARFKQGVSFAECLMAQNVNDEAARLIMARLDQIEARLEILWTRLSAASAEQPDEAWDNLLQTADLHPVAFNLNEQRDLARQKMSPEMEALISELATDGYHAWDQLYNLASGLKQVPFEEDGATRSLSLGQLQNKFYDDPDRDVRQRAFIAFEAAWTELAPICALALNYQAGFRLTTYRHRSWESVLHEPLVKNRLSRQTLDTMWGVIADKSDKLLDYFAAKATLLSLDKLTWYDVSAPLGALTQTFSFAEASDFVIDNLRTLNPDIANFCRMAIDKRWVETENRPGKQTGAFCTGFPLIGETRIFMTFNNSYNGMSTLAHELGHSYHSWVMRDLPFGARRYTMGVAETASTFNELAVTDAYLKTTTKNDERLSMLNQKLDNAASFLMNLRARFDFEQAFFDRRAKGQLSVEELSNLMLEAQKTAYCRGLAENGYHPLFWASKLHFYITRAPFYNFPYTFGYLFSYGVYTQALQDGAAFRDRYLALLRDTGSMDTETLARTHLGIDLTQPKFWESVIDEILSEVDEFVALANSSRSTE
jgi:pepF/M3 family oligoendopeptidase